MSYHRAEPRQMSEQSGNGCQKLINRKHKAHSRKMKQIGCTPKIFISSFNYKFIADFARVHTKFYGKGATVLFIIVPWPLSCRTTTNCHIIMVNMFDSGCTVR